MNDTVTKQITETKYLSTENSWRYRTILRYFFEEYEKIKYWIYKEDIYAELKKYPLFVDYTIEHCAQDLDVLVSWGNLVAVQDTGKVTTIEAFKNRQFRYELTEYTIEIERLIIRLENLSIEGSSLEPSLLERFKNNLKMYTKMLNRDFKQVGVWWVNLNNDFKILNENYKDYIKSLYSVKSEDMIKSKEFIIFKDRIIQYLRDFIKSLQTNISDIEFILSEISQVDIKAILLKILEYEQNIPHTEIVKKDILYENIDSKWKNMSSWFLNSQGNQSEAVKLFEKTNDIIRKITRYAVQISERLDQNVNKKDEYKKILKLFLDCENIEVAHCLSAHVFGIEHMRHIQADIKRETESINGSVFDESPLEMIIKPKVRTYREKMKYTVIKDKSEEKNKLLNEVLEKRNYEEQLLNQYIVDGYIIFENLVNISSFVRITFLAWLSTAIISSDYSGKTETGKLYRIINPDEIKKCILTCEDGEFEMPAYKLKMENGD